ncbi:MAG: hypothetical protein H6R14_3051, partial [Proteobacteria bacterium]|nr:hypothetical protein [Pseudomonadota bacterium]
WRGLRNSGLRPSDSPRPFSANACVARHLSRGPANQRSFSGFQFWPKFPVDRQIAIGGRHSRVCGNPGGRWIPACAGMTRAVGKSATPSGPPWKALSNAGGPGGVGLPCLSRRRVLASRPALRVAQGTGQSPAPTPGSPFLWLLSFGEAKESTPARQARKPAFQKRTPTGKQRKPAHQKRDAASGAETSVSAPSPTLTTTF